MALTFSTTWVHSFAEWMASKWSKLRPFLSSFWTDASFLCFLSSVHARSSLFDSSVAWNDNSPYSTELLRHQRLTTKWYCIRNGIITRILRKLIQRTLTHSSSLPLREWSIRPQKFRSSILIADEFIPLKYNIVINDITVYIYCNG